MRVQSNLKSNFLAGLALVAPIVVTLFILRTLVGWILGFLKPIARDTQAVQLIGDPLLARVLVGVALLALITLVGSIAQYSIGRRLFGRAGRALYFIPVFREVYTSVKQVATSVVNRSTQYESVVFVEYPRDGVYSLGLVTGNSPADAERLAGQEVYNVFFPSSPNPTGGKLVLVPDEKVHETDLSVRRGLQILMTTGMTEPDAVIDLEEDDEEGAGDGSLPSGAD
jgi:uncharacterized membrane protein